MNYDRKAMKEAAKAAIRDTRPKAWLVTLIFMLLAVALPALVTEVFNPMRELLPQIFEDMALMARTGEKPDELWVLDLVGQLVRGGVAVLFISVLFSLFAVVMNYGYRDYGLRVYQRQSAQVGTLFSGFPVAGQAIGTEIMTAVFVFLWTMLINLVCGLVMGLCGGLFSGVLHLDWLAAVFTGLVSLVSVVLCLLVALRYCLAPYFVLTDPDAGVMNAIRSSKTAMRGNYVKKFLLDLSFLGWQLLVAVILYAVALLGAVVVLLMVSGDWIAELRQIRWDILTEEKTLELIFSNTGELLRSIMLPMTVVGMVAWLAALPLNLWLQAYMSASNAGFFLYATGGRAAHLSGQAPAPSAPLADYPPVPPAAPVAPEVPEIPETPAIPKVPETPAIPEVPETPAAPEAPEVPQSEAPDEA